MAISNALTPETFEFRVREGSPEQPGPILHTFTVPVLKEVNRGMRWIVVKNETFHVKNTEPEPLSCFAEYVVPQAVADLTGIVTDVSREVGTQRIEHGGTLTLLLRQGQIIYRLATGDECDTWPLR